MTHCTAAVDEAGFRSMMARFATGVTVITSIGADGPAGMTANAGKQPEREKFTACAYTERAGVPVMAGALAWLCCRVSAVYPGGDHVIVVGEAVEMGGNGGEPLLFYGGSYRRLDRACATGRAAGMGQPGRAARAAR